MVEGLGRVHLLHDAVVQDHDSVAHGHGLDLVMGNVNKRGLETLMQLEDLHASLDPQLGVEVGKGLVHQEHLRLADDGPPQRDALPLAAGERLGFPIQIGIEPQDLGRLANPFVDLGFRRLAQLQAEREIVVHRHVRIECVGLEDHGDVPVLRGDVVDDAIPDEHLAVRDLLQAGQHPQGGGLARARGTDQDHELLVFDLHAHVVDDDIAWIALKHVLVYDPCHRHPSLSPSAVDRQG